MIFLGNYDPRKDFSVKSEFNMALLDFERYDAMLRFADEAAIKVRVGQYEFIPSYFSVLKQIFINFIPFLHESVAEELDKKFKYVEQNIEIDKNKVKISVSKILEDIHKELLILRQKIGLGLPVRKIHLNNIEMVTLGGAKNGNSSP